MKLLLPNVRKLRIMYSLLLLKALDRGVPIVTYEEVSNAVAVAGTTPNKYQVKKYLLMLMNHSPPLLKFHRAGLFTTQYRVLIYGVDEEVFPANLSLAERFRGDIILALSEEETENTITFAELLKMKLSSG